MITTYAYGFPRLGVNREYKQSIESYWRRKISSSELRENIDKLEATRLATYEKYVNRFPVGEMTLYDNMVDTALMLGLYHCDNLDDYYNLCIGKKALTLTKWFNTNYHYLVPEFASPIPRFRAAWNKPKEAIAKYKKGVPYLIGPFTFLKLSTGIAKERFGDYLLALAEVYAELISDLDEVHIDEPALVWELPPAEVQLIKLAYQKMRAANCKINLFTYYDSVDFMEDLYELPVAAIGLDMINGQENLKAIRKYGFPEDKTLICGIVNGSNVWRTNIESAVATLNELSRYAKSIVISNASPLYHLPITIAAETLDRRLAGRLSFAEERLYELKLIAQVYAGNRQGVAEWNKQGVHFDSDPGVKERIKHLKDSDFSRSIPYSERVVSQQQRLALPLFPTSTIGSFPQTPVVRKKRAEFRTGRLSQEDYNTFIRQQIAQLITLQEELGLDVFVHGEFERSDMVEFFAEKLNGIATTLKGWIISYGTRVYRPPIIYSDVSRPNPMTVDEIAYAQSLTPKPVKGMLTGPVTIIAWSFVRDDIPVSEIAYQIALCLQDEIRDYEANGIKIVQVDEPAFREKAPLKRRDWDQYFNWAVKAFRLASQAKPETQVQTHMCYSEFGDIIDRISQMDFDVITIEASRSRGNITRDFIGGSFDRQIGLGVWDIHSPQIPSPEDMAEIVTRALEVFPKENLWLNPDCGLKTRRWEEVIPSLKNLIILAGRLRKGASSLKNATD
ncbi:MAG: 5-methyltetrahydropteroyltriglutamate--homocysteine S-methyltransferase [Dehalococcoidales bacterium]|nr:5-methyltetrahydropteroyltriglutamate--homocysteine S-methyltransferase [Dehalococcoidales bacterium]